VDVRVCVRVCVRACEDAVKIIPVRNQCEEHRLSTLHREIVDVRDAVRVCACVCVLASEAAGRIIRVLRNQSEEHRLNTLHREIVDVRDAVRMNVFVRTRVMAYECVRWCVSVLQMVHTHVKMCISQNNTQEWEIQVGVEMVHHHPTSLKSSHYWHQYQDVPSSQIQRQKRTSAVLAYVCATVCYCVCVNSVVALAQACVYASTSVHVHVHLFDREQRAAIVCERFAFQRTAIGNTWGAVYSNLR